MNDTVTGDWWQCDCGCLIKYIIYTHDLQYVIRSTFCHVTEKWYNVLSVQIGHTVFEHGVFYQLLILPVYFLKKHMFQTHLSPFVATSLPLFLLYICLLCHRLISSALFFLTPYLSSFAPIGFRLSSSAVICHVCPGLSSFVSVCLCLFPIVHPYFRQLPSVSNHLYTISPRLSTCVSYLERDC